MGLTYYLPNISGVTQYAVILAEELIKRNYKLGIITSRFNKNLNKTEKKENIEIIRVDGIFLGKGFLMPKYFWESRQMVKNYETVICHLPSIESIWLAFWAKVYQKKVIIVHHCEFEFSLPLSNLMIAMMSFPIHWLTYFMADIVVAYTQDYAKKAILLRLFKRKLKFILPPIKIKSLPSPPVKKNEAKDQQKIVGFVGRVGWEKGIDVLIKAMENIKAKLILVGPYQDVVGDSTFSKLKKIISKKVEFVGPVKHDQLGKYYKMFDCLVLPSINNLETFGIVQAEAIVCGTPVVASSLPGVRVPVMMTRMGEIAKVGDVKDLALKISEVLKNGKNYYQKRALKLEKLDYLRTVDEYEKII